MSDDQAQETPTGAGDTAVGGDALGGAGDVPAGGPGASGGAGDVPVGGGVLNGAGDVPDGAREALAGAQAVLLAALVAGGAAPPGFDEGRLRIQAASLISKRRGTVARVRPDLVALLGGDFAREFEAYARGRPKPPGGSRADARDFADRLRAAGRLPPEPETAAEAPRWLRPFRRVVKLLSGTVRPTG
ncbi:hypothetical protein ABZV14_38960 [Streptosporangium canum]|uniref:hypothetical protein n=1 Tax=Streptosporangium canum TaxID=324952 RepID=UPI0033A5B0FC